MFAITLINTEMKYSRFIVQNTNLKAFMLVGFLFAGSSAFAQTVTQTESVPVSKSEMNEYPTDPVVVPADLKKHSIEQTAIVAAMPVSVPVVTKKRVGFVSISNPHF
jgi:hypothetical protein